MNRPGGVFILVNNFYMDNLSQYLRATVAEMKQVKWPTQNQAMIYTAMVLVICTITALFVGFFDFLFSQAIDLIVNRF